MDQQQLAVFKYKHGDRIGLSGKRLLALFASIAAALFLTSLMFPFGILTLHSVAHRSVAEVLERPKISIENAPQTLGIPVDRLRLGEILVFAFHSATPR